MATIRLARLLRHSVWATLLPLVLLCVSTPAQPVQPNAPPVNPDSTPAARALLRQLDHLSGRAILGGEHNYPNTISAWSNRVYELTDKYPAIFGEDFGFAGGQDKDSTLSRPAMIREVIRQYRAGAIPALCWHAVPPTEQEPVTFQDSILSHLSDWEFDQLLTPGTELHIRWERQVDRVAGYLRELQEAGVPVLFRPYHEMNGNWFWWGGRSGDRGSSALYRMIFDRYVHVHHLNNLLWVWNVGASSSNSQPPESFWPGSNYVDVVSMDVYRPYVAKDYDSMVQLAADNKPMALAEVGTAPDAEVLKQQPRWTYFMIWSEFAENHNTPEALKETFNLPNVIDRGDPRLSVPFPVTDDQVTLKSGETAASGPEKLRLSLLTGSAVIDEVDAGPDPAAAVSQAIARIHAAGHVPLLRWSPPSPTGSAAAAPLDNYTWSQLLSPDTPLHRRWTDEIDTLGKLLETAGTDIVLVSPLPGANAGLSWWSRPGLDGSQALFHEVQQRLAASRIRNVLWVWEVSTTSAKRATDTGLLVPYFPGPLNIGMYLLDLNGNSDDQQRTLRSLSELFEQAPLATREARTGVDGFSIKPFLGRYPQ